MDEKERTQLYTLDGDLLRETERVEAVARIEDTQTKYQQHLTFTTQLPGEAEIDQRQAAQLAAQGSAGAPSGCRHLRGGRPSARRRNVHVHICFGTDTTLRRGAEGDLVHFQHQAYQLEQQLGREMGLTHDRADDQQQKHPSKTTGARPGRLQISPREAEGTGAGLWNGLLMVRIQAT